MKILDSNHNSLGEFPVSLEQLSGLEELNLNGNSITKISIQTEGALPSLKCILPDSRLLLRLDLKGSILSGVSGKPSIPSISISPVFGVVVDL